MHARSLCRGAAVALAAAACAVAAPALADGGTVKGKVDATPPKYLEDTVVYLKEVPGSYPKKTHPYDQKGMRFIPHVMTITVGDTVDFLNHDNLVHNVYSSDGEGYNLGSFKQDEKRSHTFEKQGVYGQLCSIHPEMQGYIFVGQNPYAAAVDKKGEFEIKNVPPGSYKLAVWNSHLKAPEKPVTVAAGKPVEESFSLKR
ncbi:MAG TPA: plastocyanin/azurin family copper-binding protein [Anaeromyxobacteraceae bacterium]|nr:plastocyanin/azurin family copper-binding protein [Anaeromyxobacteraceae bacterium]